METVWLAVGGIAGLAIGIVGGFKWGEALRTKSSAAYWAANGVVMIAGMGTVFVGTAWGIGALWIGGIGIMGGGITGLKYGLGKSVGIWRTADRLMGTDDLPKH